MEDNLKKEFQFYLDHQQELLEKYRGKYVVIKGARVVGSHDTEMEAILETSKEHQLGSFLVQKCEPGSESYTQTYHSRVAFG
jgi:hypothetical protein